MLCGGSHPALPGAYYNIRKTTLEAKLAEKYPEHLGYDALDSGQWFKEKIGYKLEWKRFLFNANTFLFLSRLLFAGFQAPITVIDLSGPCAESEVSFIDTEKLLYAFVLMMACCCCGMFGTVSTTMQHGYAAPCAGPSRPFCLAVMRAALPCSPRDGCLARDGRCTACNRTNGDKPGPRFVVPPPGRVRRFDVLGHGAPW